MSIEEPSVDCFVIGAMKAGTTAMCDWLDEQPGVTVSHPKEPAVYVSDETTAAWTGRVGSLYPGAHPGDRRVDGSTDYAKFPTITGVPQRLAARHPEARFVYMMRDPIARAISQYRFEWMLGGDTMPFDEALATNTALIDYSRYALQLQQWIACFDPARFLLIFAEEFARHPPGQVRRVLHFLGLDDGEVMAPPQSRSNQTDMLVRPTLARRILRESRLGRTVRPLVPTAVTRAYKRRVAQSSQPHVTEAHRTELARIFDDDLIQLTQLTAGPGITCATWKTTTATWTPQLRLP